MAPAGTHTHTAPPRPVTKAPPCTLGGEGGMPRPRHRHAAVSTRLPVFYALKSPPVDNVGRNNGDDWAASGRNVGAAANLV